VRCSAHARIDAVSATLCTQDVTTDCGHLLCELIDGACSLATGRSRGCRANLVSKSVAPDIVDEVRVLLAVIDPDVRDERVQKAAVRLAEIMRREARDGRHLLAYARIEEPELAPALARLCVRRR
jgi:hypothetical protein